MKNILVIEPDANLRENITIFLNEIGGYNIKSVSSQEEGFKVIRSTFVHTLILNCWNQKVDEIISLTKKLWGTKVICMTTKSQHDHSEADYWLSMPFSIDDFFNALC